MSAGVDAAGGRAPARTVEEAEREVAAAAAELRALREAIGRVIVGHEEVVRGVLTCLLAGGHALLEGVPGLGKTMLVRALAQALDVSFARIQFTPDLMPADIVGTQILVDGPAGRRFEFARGPLFAHVVLADEINRATPKTQSALLEAMQERSVTVARTAHRLEEPFLVLATQNPLEMEGTYPLPEAQLDRFFFKLKVAFPDRDALHAILDRTCADGEPRLEPVADRARVLALQATARRLPVARDVQDYVVRLVQATHPDRPDAPEATRRHVRYGASPRGAQALLTGARIRALWDGRAAPGFADVRAVAHPALRHRLILNFEGEAEGVAPDAIVDQVLARVPELAG